MRIWHVDTSARLSAKGARGLGDLCYARTEVERRTHEMQTFFVNYWNAEKINTNIRQQSFSGNHLVLLCVMAEFVFIFSVLIVVSKHGIKVIFTNHSQ